MFRSFPDPLPDREAPSTNHHALGDFLKQLCLGDGSTVSPKPWGNPERASGSCQPNRGPSEPAEGPGRSSTNVADSG